MARKVALIPEELVSSYKLQKPEIRLEDDIVKLLDQGKLPDDMKVKLLGQLVTRYQRTVHEPPEPVRVSIAENETSKATPEPTPLIDNEKVDPVLKDILFSVPHNYSKFIPLIIEKLKTRGYGWNDIGEMTRNDLPIRHTRIADLFSYLMRNTKSVSEPQNFDVFFNAINEINIPRTWIGNKNILRELHLDDVKNIGKQIGKGRLCLSKTRFERKRDTTRAIEQPLIWRDAEKRTLTKWLRY